MCYECFLINCSLESMNDHRENAIGAMTSLIDETLDHFLNDRHDCSRKFECCSIMFGALVKQLNSSSLFSPKPVAPFVGSNYRQFVQTIKSFKTPQWNCNCDCDYSYRSYSDCSFQVLFEHLRDTIDGLDIHKFVT